MKPGLVETYDIDAVHIVEGPPELSATMTADHWREINLLLHSIALLGDDLGAGRPLHPILRTAAAVAPSSRGLLFRWDEVRFGLGLVAALKPEETLTEGVLEGGVQAHTALLRRRPVRVHEPGDARLVEEMRRLGAGAALSVPMVHQGMPWGVVQLLRDAPYSRDEAVLIWMFAIILEGMLPSLVGDRLHREGPLSIDRVTGLLTPDHFRRRLAWELRRAAWLHRPVSLLSVRVGEPASGPFRSGGASLRHDLPNFLLRTLRQRDSLTSLEGHHYVAALPDTPGVAARAVAETIRTDLIACGGGTLPASCVNTGWAVYPDDATAEEDLIRHACRAMTTGGSPRGRVG